MHGINILYNGADCGLYGRKRGFRKIVVTVVSLVSVVAILSVSAIMRDNAKISAESAGKYTSDRDVILQDMTASLDGSVAEMQKWMQEMQEVTENSMESIVGSEAFLSNLESRLSEMDSLLSDVMIQTEHAENLIATIGVNTGTGSDEGKNGSMGVSSAVSVDENNVSDDFVINGTGLNIMQDVSVANSELKETVSASQKEIKELVSVLRSGNTDSFAAVYDRTEKLQETADGILEIFDENLLELNGLIVLLQDTSGMEHQEMLGSITELQEGLVFSMQSLLHPCPVLLISIYQISWRNWAA